MGLRGEGALEIVQALTLAFVQGGGGAGGGVDAEPPGLRGDVGPDATLITFAGAVAAQGLADVPRLTGAAGGEVGAAGARELGGLRIPAPGLDAGDGDDNGLMGRGQDAEVEDAVLLGADQFLPIQQQHGQVAIIDEAELRHAAALADLSDAGATQGQGLVEELVTRLGRTLGQQGQEGQVAVLLGVAQGDLGQAGGDEGHGPAPA